MLVHSYTNLVMVSGQIFSPLSSDIFEETMGRNLFRPVIYSSLFRSKKS
jgi:hypothetical protein